MEKQLSPLVIIVILNYNGWSDTIECLESILKSDYNNFKIVLVDNDSTDGSILKIKEWAKGNLVVGNSFHPSFENLIFPFHPKPINIQPNTVKFSELGHKSIILIQAYQNNGFSAGNNIGIVYSLEDSQCEFVWLLNNDTIVPPDCLKELVIHSSADSNLGLLGAKLVYYSKPEVIQALAGTINKNTGASTELGQGQNLEFRLQEDVPFDYIVGASMFAKRKFIEDVGLMCEDYFLYNEEPDWCLRALKKGWAYNVCYNSVVYHKQGSSTGNSSKIKSEKIDLIGLKSRLIFMRKFYPNKMTLVYFSFLGVILNRVKRFQFKRIPKIIKLMFDK